MVEQVHIAPPDPVAPARFLSERTFILSCFAQPPVLVEHIGSTAVPGLPAKPVIDIIVLVADLAQGHAAVPALEAGGYSYWRDDPVTTKLLLAKGLPNRTHNLHIHADPDEVRRHILFRDHLRASAAYADLKHHLAERFRDDREAYSDAKSAFIDRIMAEIGGPRRAYSRRVVTQL